jgi:hypothetical protein
MDATGRALAKMNLHENLRFRWSWVVPLIVAATAALAACSGGDADYSPQRAISEDIDATYDSGPTSLNRGEDPRDEPEGAFPWRIK